MHTGWFIHVFLCLWFIFSFTFNFEVNVQHSEKLVSADKTVHSFIWVSESHQLFCFKGLSFSAKAANPVISDKIKNKLVRVGLICTKWNNWKWTEARKPMVTPLCNKDDVRCITWNNKTTDQFVTLTLLSLILLILMFLVVACLVSLFPLCYTSYLSSYSYLLPLSCYV